MSSAALTSDIQELMTAEQSAADALEHAGQAALEIVHEAHTSAQVQLDTAKRMAEEELLKSYTEAKNEASAAAHNQLTKQVEFWQEQMDNAQNGITQAAQDVVTSILSR